MDDGGTIAIIVAIIGTGVALWRVNKSSMDRLHTDLEGVKTSMGDLRERMSRLEGRFDEMSRYIATITGRGRPVSGDAD